MLFPTLDYFLFLPLVAVVHWLLRGIGSRALWILVVSVAFYAAWNPLDLALLLGIIAATWGGALAIDRAAPQHKKPLQFGVVALLLAPLLFYKYTHFVAESLATFLPIGVPEQGHLPIGISFYTFQALAYVIDVSRGQAPERRFLRFSAFLLFFPHLVAGPILRASVLLEQIGRERQLSREDVNFSVYRLILGLIKKVLVADVLRVGMVDSVFTDPGSFTGPEVMVALYAYTLQIYCDFSGYTDFAIGSARLLGFHIPENFDRPYQALTVGEYWRRWHITLSDWVRDYVYYPMGGSRAPGWKVYRNTFLTLLILAVWHGANWTFVVYGCIHGVAVSLNRAFRRKAGPDGKLPAMGGFDIAWRWALTFHFVVLARILFRSDSLAHAGQVSSALLSPVWAMPRYAPHAWAVLLLGYAVHLSPRAWERAVEGSFVRLPPFVAGVVLAGVAAACVEFGVGDTLSFIYYDF